MSEGWQALVKSEDAATRLRGARQLERQVMYESRDMPPAPREKILNKLNDVILGMVNSANIRAKTGGIVAMEHMIDFFLGHRMEAKIIQFASSLRTVLEKSADLTTLTVASKALGNLTRHGGTTLIELVEENIIRPAFGALQQASAASARRLSAVLVLQELALNNPTLFYLYADQFFTTIWVALKDVGADTRQAAASSLSASLQLLAARDSKHRDEWHALDKDGKRLDLHQAVGAIFTRRGDEACTIGQAERRQSHCDVRGRQRCGAAIVLSGRACRRRCCRHTGRS